MQLISKKKYALEIVFEIILLLGLAFGLLLPSLKKLAEKYTHNSLVTTAKLDFKLPSPSTRQISEMESLKSVDNVFPFFETFTSIEVNGNIQKDNYVMIIPIQYMEKFPFCRKQLLIKNTQTNNDIAYVYTDYSFSKENKVRAGDKINISIGNDKKDYIISGITNNFGDLLSSTESQKNVVLVFIDTNTFFSILGKNVSYSGAYVSCNDVDAFKQFLVSYKPYGRMKDRNAFDSDQQFNEYKDYFNKGEYGAEILNLELRNHLDNSNIQMQLSFIFACISIVFILVLYILTISDKTLIYNSFSLIQNGEDYNVITNRVRTLLKFIIFIGTAEIIILFCIFINSLNNYCPIKMVIPTFFITIILPFVIEILLMFVFSKIVSIRNKHSFEDTKKDIQKTLGNKEIETGSKWKDGKKTYLKFLYDYSVSDNLISIEKLNIDTLVYCTELNVYEDCSDAIQILLKQKKVKNKGDIKLSENGKSLVGKVSGDNILILEYTKIEN